MWLWSFSILLKLIESHLFGTQCILFMFVVVDSHFSHGRFGHGHFIQVYFARKNILNVGRKTILSSKCSENMNLIFKTIDSLT
jgi:hypothetical protein